MSQLSEIPLASMMSRSRSGFGSSLARLFDHRTLKLEVDVVFARVFLATRWLKLLLEEPRAVTESSGVSKEVYKTLRQDNLARRGEISGQKA